MQAFPYHGPALFVGMEKEGQRFIATRATCATATLLPAFATFMNLANYHRQHGFMIEEAPDQTRWMPCSRDFSTCVWPCFEDELFLLTEDCVGHLILSTRGMLAACGARFAIPILIELIFRHRRRRIELPTIRYLLKDPAHKKTQRQDRLLLHNRSLPCPNSAGDRDGQAFASSRRAGSKSTRCSSDRFDVQHGAASRRIHGI